MLFDILKNINKFEAKLFEKTKKLEQDYTMWSFSKLQEGATLFFNNDARQGQGRDWTWLSLQIGRITQYHSVILSQDAELAT